MTYDFFSTTRRPAGGIGIATVAALKYSGIWSTWLQRFIKPTAVSRSRMRRVK